MAVVSDSDVPAFNRGAFLTFEHLLPFSPELMQVVQPIFLDLCRIHTHTHSANPGACKSATSLGLERPSRASSH